MIIVTIDKNIDYVFRYSYTTHTYISPNICQKIIKTKNIQFMKIIISNYNEKYHNFDILKYYGKFCDNVIDDNMTNSWLNTLATNEKLFLKSEKYHQYYVPILMILKNYLFGVQDIVYEYMI